MKNRKLSVVPAALLLLAGGVLLGFADVQGSNAGEPVRVIKIDGEHWREVEDIDVERIVEEVMAGLQEIDFEELSHLGEQIAEEVGAALDGLDLDFDVHVDPDRPSYVWKRAEAGGEHDAHVSAEEIRRHVQDAMRQVEASLQQIDLRVHRGDEERDLEREIRMLEREVEQLTKELVRLKAGKDGR